MFVFEKAFNGLRYGLHGSDLSFFSFLKTLTFHPADQLPVVGPETGIKKRGGEEFLSSTAWLVAQTVFFYCLVSCITILITCVFYFLIYVSCSTCEFELTKH